MRISFRLNSCRCFVFSEGIRLANLLYVNHTPNNLRKTLIRHAIFVPWRCIFPEAGAKFAAAAAAFSQTWEATGKQHDATREQPQFQLQYASLFHDFTTVLQTESTAQFSTVDI
jgi:hypothetical protein